MGGGNPIKKAVKKVTAEAKREISREFTIGNDSGALGKFKDFTGIDLKKTNIVAQGKRHFVDKPAEQKAEQQKLGREQDVANKKAIADIEKREAQEGAEKTASKDLARARAKQKRQSKGSGRRSTILTDKLGGAGGESGQRKSLLGL